jgi:DNA repair and recombination protein RAD54 and RAD54-like protein
MCTFKKRIFEGMYMLEKPGMTIGEDIAGRSRSMQKCMDKKLLEWGMFSKPIKIDILDSSSESKEEIPPPAAMQQGLLSSSEDYNAEARRKRRNKNKKREKKPDNTSDDEYQMKARRYQR